MPLHTAIHTLKPTYANEVNVLRLLVVLRTADGPMLGTMYDSPFEKPVEVRQPKPSVNTN